MTYNNDYYDDEEILSLKSYIEKIKEEIKAREQLVNKSREELEDLYDSIKSLGSVFKRTENAVNYNLRMQEKNTIKKQVDAKKQDITEQEKDLQKAKDLTAKLTPYVGKIEFIEVPFTEIQEEIKKNIPQGYWMTITRRMMLRLTDEIRRLRHGLIILNGESLGQVASQTLQSMVAINEVTNTPIIRPVATMDKLEIIEVAEQIDTFELSVQPFEDCCTIFAPPQPKTRPRLDKVHQYEERLPIEEMIERALSGLKMETIHTATEAEQVEEFADLL